jgi:hypothetical protein
LAPLLKRQAHADIAAEKLFGRDRLLMDGPLHKILFVASHDSPEIRVTPIDPDEVAQRMVHSLQYEQSVFLGYYRMFRFAFPQRTCDLVENSETLQQELLRSALANKEAYVVHHPYPVSLPHLFEAIAPLCNSTEAARGVREPCALAQGGGLR